MILGRVKNKRTLLTPSLSQWERERPFDGCGRIPSPMGRGLG